MADMVSVLEDPATIPREAPSGASGALLTPPPPVRVEPMSWFAKRLGVQRIKWEVLVAIALLHLGVLAAPATFTWPAFWVAFSLYWITGGLGVCLCYHRLLAHRSFQAPKWLEYLLTFFGAIALQGGPIKWVTTHRIHHAFADRPGDPHSPNRGFWWAHMLWLFVYDELVDNPAKAARYVADLEADPVHRFLNRTQGLQIALILALLFAWGGWPFVIWGFAVRIVAVYHCTWLVNSAAHIWGYRTYAVRDRSTNNWWVAVLSFGEGWHNNHHAFLRSAAHGLRWWEIDPTYLIIKFLALVRLASKVRCATKAVALRRLAAVSRRTRLNPVY